MDKFISVDLKYRETELNRSQNDLLRFFIALKYDFK